MSTSYETARKYVGKQGVWECVIGNSRKAIFATLISAERNETTTGKSVVLKLKTDDPDQPFLNWDARDARLYNKDSEDDVEE